jgi:hypothetical protein
MSAQQIAPKSIPFYEVLATLLTLADHGTTGAVTDQGAAKFDLVEGGANDVPYHEGLLKIEAKTTNGQGGTPTSPGSGKTITFKYAFCADDLTAADAPTLLANVADSLTITLPDSSSAAVAGQRYHATDPFVASGRYLYIWYDRVAFAANALVDLTAKLVRC